MKKLVKYSFFILFVIFFSNCEKDKAETDNIQFDLKTVSINNEIDEKVWGNFNLVLELEKSTFSKDESCITQLSFANIGEKEISLEGILPNRQSVSEPFIYLNSFAGEYYRIDTLLEEVRNEDLIIIRAGNSVKLMKFNLTDVKGKKIIENNDGFSVTHMEIRLGDELKTGKYYISASFFPMPLVYSCKTDTLSFEIK